MTQHHVLEGDSIDFRYGDHSVLTGVYIKCETGKVTGLLGRNGTGKSTLFNILFGTASPGGGSVRWNSKYVRSAFRKNGLVSYMPQFPSIPGHLSFKKLLKLFGYDDDQVEEVLSYHLVKKHFTTRISNLSTGERKLLEALLLLHSRSHFVLLDEPFSFLSPLQVEQLLPVVRSQARTKGILLTDHRYQQVIDSSDTVLLLKNGSVHPIQGIDGLKSLGYIR
ncbi:ABC transporter ATP-binding protein [Imperialibacter roseus]|uniref:ABC transporter ATP-binding protein n=1 Tax=Imperialibacter roseus TaxID=1324217 RepID=A0ABZ0IWW8_9BACT|nr:ABC transporter ATP-binding protein [Imperialibacter roseus]WOK08889.1 ABC transporter ATP-binding protein [Imperialibacter roseus]